VRLAPLPVFVTAALVFSTTLAYSATQTVSSPQAWTQFRLENSNNAVLPGSLEVAWRLRGLGPISSSPTFANGVLYVGDNMGALYALDPLTGRTLWRARVSNPLMSAPIVYKDLVIVGEGDENSPQGSSPSHPIRVGAPPSALIAFDRNTGAIRWRLPLKGSGMPTPAIINGILVHHNGAGEVLGVRPETGATIYTRNLHSVASMVAALPVSGGRFATSGIEANAVWLLNAKDGSVVWHTDFSPVASGLGDCPAASDGKRLYCNYVMPPSTTLPVQTERQAVLRAYAIDLRTGKRAWDVALDKGVLPKRNEAAIPLVADGVLYFGSPVESSMHAIDPQTGALKWKAATHGAVKGGVVAVGGTIYFGDLGGYLWALDAKSGNVIGVMRTGTPFNVGSPLVIGQTLVIGSRGGTLVAVPLKQIRQSHDQ
jgi:outer membrane protein assembly factor BamB